MSALKKLASETVVYGLSSVIGRLLGYLLVPLYTRVFVPGEYGIVTELYAYVAFFAVFFTYGMESAFFRYSMEHPHKKVFTTAFTSLIVSTLVFGAVLMFFSGDVATALGYPENRNYIIWFALILVFDTFAALPFARLRQLKKGFKYATIKLINIGLNIGLNLFFLLLCPYLIDQGYTWVESIYNPNMGVGYVFISNLVANGITLFMLMPIVKENFQLGEMGFDKALWKRMFRYAFPLLLGGLAGIINETFDRIILKSVLPGTQLENQAAIGIYGAVYKFAMLMTLFTTTYRMAAEPFFYEQAKNQSANKLYALSMRYFVIVGSLIFLLIMVFMPLFKHFLGSEYFSGLHVVPYLLIANLFLGVYFNLSVWYRIKDKTNYGAWFSLLGAIITIGGNLLLIPIYGYAGAAYVTLACYAVMALASYFAGQKFMPVDYQPFHLLFYLCLAIAFWWMQDRALLEMLATNPFWVYGVKSATVLTYLFIVYKLERKRFVNEVLKIA